MALPRALQSPRGWAGHGRYQLTLQSKNHSPELRGREDGRMVSVWDWMPAFRPQPLLVCPRQVPGKWGVDWGS